MITKEEIKKLKDGLRRGDQKAIAKQTGLTTMHVGNFFNGNEDLVSEETALKIISSATKLIKQRNKVTATAKKLIDSL